jgi:outer membrane protein OmpU|tara:strand:+ start:41 stop:1009 length:969 start_codon:yes stop_codon:yes gene_type:complete
MNIKKIGLTALAASLVSVSAHAGAVSVSGGASMNTEGYSGENLNAGTTFSMGNQLTFTGSGELDNGMTVSISYVIDQGDDENQAETSPFDSHSVKVSSEALGTLTLAGEGGSSAATSIDGTAAGDIWDTFDGTRGSATAVAVSDSGTGDNGLFYSMPSVMDGLDVFASYQPQGSGRESATGFGATYSGFDGLSLSYATTDEAGTTVALSGDQTVYKVSYAYGPITATLSESEFDVGTGTADQTTGSFALSYTVSDEISVTYGEETIEKGGSTTDAEYSAISASYTSGGMTISMALKEAENVAHGTGTNEDFEYWSLGASFAF